MEDRFEKAARGLAVVAVAVVVVVSFVPMWFAHPLADDLVRWHQGAVDGWQSVVRQNYLEWTGRWASAALEAGLLHWLEGHRYGAALAALACVQLVASFAFVRLVLQQTVTRRSAAGLTLCLFALQWSGLPEAGETVYWFTGAIEYQLSLSLAVILVWQAACVRPQPRVLHAGWAVALALLTLLITGLHELTALMLTIVLAMAGTIAYRLRSDRLPLWCCLLAVAMVGLLISLLAPGNAGRAVHFPTARDPLKTVGLTAKFVFRDMSVWIADPKLLAASLFLLLNPWFTRLRPAWLTWDIPWGKLVPVTGLCFIAMGAAALGFSTASSPPGRAENLLYHVFLMSWFVTVLARTRWPDNWILRREAPAPFLQAAALACLGLALLTTGNTNTALRDLDKRLYPWHTAMRLREQLAQAAEPGMSLVLPEPPPMPALFFQSDIQKDAADWRNQAYARFHDLAIVRIETELDRLRREARHTAGGTLR
jgi:hypothetical protein